MKWRCSKASLIAAAAAALAPGLAYAQSADLVLCDRVAADPADPDKPADAKGVPDIAAVRHRHRHQVLQDRREFVAPGDVPARPRLCRQPADGGSDRGLAQGGRQRLDLGHGRTRRALWRPARASRRDEAQARKLFERAAQAGNPRGVSNLARSRRRRGTPPIRRGRANCCRRPPRPMPRRNINSA